MALEAHQNHPRINLASPLRWVCLSSPCSLLLLSGREGWQKDQAICQMAMENQGRRVLGCPTSKDTGNLMSTVILEVKQTHYSYCFSIQPSGSLATFANQICETGSELIFLQLK